MKGLASAYVAPSTVTCRSAMHSSSADWVFGDARLISSAITMLAKTGPGRNSNSVLCRLKIDRPVMSTGIRSGVNWTRLTEPSIERAIALASDVLPTPGTSSTSRWPSANKVTSATRITSGLPTITRWTLAAMRAPTSATSGAPRGAPSVRLLVVVTGEAPPVGMGLQSLKRRAGASAGRAVRSPPSPTEPPAAASYGGAMPCASSAGGSAAGWYPDTAPLHPTRDELRVCPTYRGQEGRSSG